jgi:hypothetical protein
VPCRPGCGRGRGRGTTASPPGGHRAVTPRRESLRCSPPPCATRPTATAGRCSSAAGAGRGAAPATPTRPGRRQTASCASRA